MAEMQQIKCRNVLLARLDPADYARVAPHLETVDLGLSALLVRPGASADWVYFPETAVASVVERTDPIRLEIAVVGFEGFVGVSQLVGAGSSPYATIVQVPGQLLRMPVPAFEAALAECPGVRAILLRYAQALLVQISSTAVSLAIYSVVARVARCLLMMHDRVELDEIAITHEMLALMLAVRRPGITVATHILEGEGAIRALRGRIIIRHRQRLMKAAQGSYGVAEAEYTRLLGDWRGASA